jgi:hypothetical protein
MSYFSGDKLSGKQDGGTWTDPFLPVIVSSTALLLVAVALAFTLVYARANRAGTLAGNLKSSPIFE